jgi:RHS repeat-associated protein
VDGERWIPGAINYRGDWRSGHKAVAAQSKPQNDLLLRALYGNPEILAVMKKVTPATVASGILRNLVSPEHLVGSAGVTAVTGQVLRLNGQPLSNVTLSIGSRSVRTDVNGEFTLANVPDGHQVLLIDGSSANRAGHQYGQYEYGLNITADQTLALPFVIWMTALDTGHEETLSSPTSAPTMVTDPEIPGLELRLPAGTVIRNAAGKIVTTVSITAIPTDQPPFPLPSTVHVPTYFTIQPGGAHLESASGQVTHGAQLVYPNFTHSPGGTRMNFWNYDASGKGWYIYGQGTVTQGGSQVMPDPGVVIYEFSGAMVSSPSNEPPTGPTPCGASAGDPVDCATGLFVNDEVDLAVSDVIPIQIRRTYRPADNVSRAFGIGTNLSYDVFNVGTSNATASSDYAYTYQDLVLPDGSHVHYPRISQGTSTADAVYQNTSAPGPFYGSIIMSGGPAAAECSGCLWSLILKDGTVYGFPDSDGSTDARVAAARIIIDRNGNTVTLTRFANNLTQITSPNGRHLYLTYDSYDRVTQASDDIGRTVSYAYDALGRLVQVTDPLGHIESYTYDTNNNMLTVTDKRGNVKVTNTYDSDGQLLTQTYPDGTASSFAYTLDTTGTYVTETNFTDERGAITQYLFNPNGYTTQVTRALGTSIQQVTSFSRDANTNLVNSTTDALGRTTNYSYDALGNTTQITLLAGTGSAVSTTVQYNPSYSESTSITDPNGNTVQLTYDPVGNLVRVTNGLGNSSNLTYDGEGRPLTVSDPNGNSKTFYYTGPNLAIVTDPLGRKTYLGADGVGRIVSITNSLGAQTSLTYNSSDKVLTITDPNGAQIQFAYDANSNEITQTDANGHSTTYTYDMRNRLTSVTDPLSHVASYAYEPGGSLSQYTDRDGQVSGWTYDALGRAVQIGFGASSSNLTAYTSIVTQTWDAANRLTQMSDSIAGTISRTFDGLDRLTQESTPQGSVSYAYDAGGRRTSMTAQGQPMIAYAWDAGNRLTQVQQAAGAINANTAQTAAFQYDSGNRRTQLVLPNGITASYAYDNDNDLLSINYSQASGTVIGNLTYTYDASGVRTSIGGSLASVTVPATSSVSNYDANNRLIQLNGVALTYDSNGSLTNDGNNSYVWDAHNRLSSISGAITAGFQYDAAGRRTLKAIAGVTTGYLYDGLNYIEEQNSSGTVTAVVMTGKIDEFFARATPSGVSVPITDALGSVLAESNTAQSITTNYTYDPYGATAQSGTNTGNAQQYAGRENDGTGLYYYRARYYSTTQARFISEDPLAWDSGQANNYAYVKDDPLRFTDPLGLCPSSDPLQPCELIEPPIVVGHLVECMYRCADGTIVHTYEEEGFCPEWIMMPHQPHGPPEPPLPPPKQ